jgi:hypothetical protein
MAHGLYRVELPTIVVLCGFELKFKANSSSRLTPTDIRRISACVGPISALQRTLAFSLNFSSRRIGLILALHGLVLCYH